VNESLPFIPDKARAMLGIGIADGSSAEVGGPKDYALRRRLRTVHPGVFGVAQKLLEALRGEWDEDIWHSLKVLVEVVETSPKPWV